MVLSEAAMVLFFYFKTGLVMTQTILTPSMEFCQETKNMVVEDYRSNRVQLGRTDLKPEKIIPICLHVPLYDKKV